MKIKDLIERLVRNYKPDDEAAYMLYTRDDVTMELQEYHQRLVGVEFTDDEKDEVLRIMDRHQDCEIGMTWMSMDVAIVQVIEERV